MFLKLFLNELCELPMAHSFYKNYNYIHLYHLRSGMMCYDLYLSIKT